MTVRGGFRSRWRAQQARAAWHLLRGLPSILRYRALEEWDDQVRWVRRLDFQRCCPHPPEQRSCHTEGYIHCRECDMLLFNHDGWRVPIPADPMGCTCGLAYRMELRRTHELEATPMRRAIRAAGGDPFVEVVGRSSRPWPTHYPECVAVWMGGASGARPGT